MTKCVASAAAARDPGQVLTKALVRSAERLRVPAKTLATIIGVSEATVSRIRKSVYTLAPGSKPFELGLLFVRLYRSLDAIVGGDDRVAAAWLGNANHALGGRPIDKIQTIAGLTDVIAYLDARRALV